jgi:hypothetical protein
MHNMPCNSDYLNANEAERECKRAATLLVYISDAIGVKLSSVSYRRQAKDYYGANNVVSPRSAVTELCRVMKTLTPDQFNKFVYDGRDATARDLADWWQRHTAADRAREEHDAAVALKEKLMASARKKLTDDEWDAMTNGHSAYA